MSRRFLHTDGNITQYYHDLGDKIVIQKVEDVSAVVEANKRALNENSKRSPMGEFVRVGCIPATVMERWCREDGINYLTDTRALLKKLEDPDNRAFKTHGARFA